MIAQAFDKLFRGEAITAEESAAVFQQLGWKPWWPDLAAVADSLRTGRKVPLLGQPQEAARIDAATACMRPVREQWLAAREE